MMVLPHKNTQPGQKTVTYRDSAGRTRIEFTFPAPPNASGQSPPVRITIVDPVAGFRYELNSTDKVALRTATPTPRPANVQPRPVLNAQGVAARASLGKEVGIPNGIPATNGAAAANRGLNIPLRSTGAKLFVEARYFKGFTSRAGPRRHCSRANHEVLSHSEGLVLLYWPQTRNVQNLAPWVVDELSGVASLAASTRCQFSPWTIRSIVVWPCFIIATVDKFAGLPWVGQVGAFFGRVSRYDAKAGFFGPCTRTA